MQPGIDPNSQNQPIMYGQQQNIIQQSQGVFPQQQVIILTPKFKPDFNFRYLSYVVFCLGVPISFLLSTVSSGDDISHYLGRLGEGTCCLSIILTFVFDAIFCKGKADWQSSTGQSNTWAVTGMIFNILFASLVMIFGYLWFIGN